MKTTSYGDRAGNPKPPKEPRTRREITAATREKAGVAHALRAGGKGTKDIADLLGMKERQVRRYLNTDQYASSS